MVCKRRVFLTAFLFMLALGNVPVLFAQDYAQEAADDSVNYYITEDEHKNIKFIQKLSWNSIPDIKNYHITIQKKTDGGYENVLEQDLTENQIEVSLEAGHYRFEVAVINLFDQIEKTSDWEKFEVLKALQPQISATETDSLFLNSKKASGLFFIDGENLNERTVFTMEKSGSEPPKILEGKIIEVAPDGSSAKVQFDINEIDEGRYEIYAKNPGGLFTLSKTIHIKNRKDREWRLLASAAYTLPVMISDGTLEKYIDANIIPLSANLKISVMSFHTKIGEFGFGLNANYSHFSADTKNYALSGNLADALFMIVYQKYFIPNRLCMEIHGGAGGAGIFGTKFTNNYNGASSPGLNSFALAFGGGLGIQYHIWKHFYVEGSIDYIQANFKDMSVGALYPSAGVGVMF